MKTAKICERDGVRFVSYDDKPDLNSIMVVALLEAGVMNPPETEQVQVIIEKKINESGTK